MADFGDDFGDEDFEDLVGDDLQALEQQAFQSTQHQAQRPNGPAHTGVVHGSRVDGGLAPPGAYVVAPQNLQGDVGGGLNQSIEYGDDDDEILDAEYPDLPPAPPAGSLIRPAPTQKQVDEYTRAQYRAPRYGGYPTAQGFQQQPLVHKEPPAVLAHRPGPQRHAELENIGNGTSSSASQNNTKDDVSALKAELQELLRERDQLQQAARDAHKQALTKDGEISIVRSNHKKALEEKDLRLKDLQQQHIEAAEKHRVELEAARKEQERLATDYRFLDHDQVIGKTKQSKQAQKWTKSKGVHRAAPQPTVNYNVPSTPKRNRQLQLGDGFDEDERSPSRVITKPKLSTPKAGEKRKRPDSPARALQISQGGEDVLLPGAVEPVYGPPPVHIFADIERKDERYTFLHKFLNHRLARKEKRTIEALGAFKFPSDHDNALSTLLLDEIAKLKSLSPTEHFAVALSSIVVSLWSRCVREKYYKPVRYLLDLARFIFLADATTVPHVMDELITLIQKTADVNTLPRYRRFRRKPTAEPGQDEQTTDDIDTQECLQLLYLTVSLCSQNLDDKARFWRLMRFDFVSLLLRPCQPIEDVITTIKLLETSVCADSFATIVADPAGQPASEKHAIDRVSSMLIERPRAAEDEEPYDAAEIAMMRLEILYLIEKLCDNRHCAEAFAAHPFALGRLVRVMSDELNAVYDYEYGHEQRIELVNLATRLLYHVTSAYGNGINLREKLQVIPGGVYKHRIALTRIAFSEGTFFGEGIETDVVDCAHQMLDELVSPEEAEALEMAFHSAHSAH